MKIVTASFLLALCFTSLAIGQSTRSAASFAGCYEVRTISSAPALMTVTRIPWRFQLSTNEIQPGRNIYEIQPLANRDNLNAKESFSWSPRADRLRLEFDTVFGRVCFTLKSTKNGEYTGSLKDDCDYSYKGLQATGVMTIRRIECSAGKTVK